MLIQLRIYFFRFSQPHSGSLLESLSLVKVQDWRLALAAAASGTRLLGMAEAGGPAADGGLMPGQRDGGGDDPGLQPWS